MVTYSLQEYLVISGGNLQIVTIAGNIDFIVTTFVNIFLPTVFQNKLITMGGNKSNVTTGGTFTRLLIILRRLTKSSICSQYNLKATH